MTHSDTAAGQAVAQTAGQAVTQVVERLQRDGYPVLPHRLDEAALTAARTELRGLLDQAGWGCRVRRRQASA